MSADTADKTFAFSLWRRIIAVLRLALIALITLLVTISLGVGRLVLFAAPGLRRRWRVWHFNAWSRAMCFVLGANTVVEGAPPQAPFFLASNHLGYLDIVVLAQVLPAVFVAKADVQSWPVIGSLTRLADTLYINRERHSDIPRANRSIADAMNSGDSVVLFPEGTSSESDFVLPVRPPLLQVAVEHDLAVNTAALHFVTRDGDPHAQRVICYYGDMDFVGHVWRLLHIRGFTVTIRFGQQQHRAAHRKQLAESVRAEILDLQSRNTLVPRPAAEAQPATTQPEQMRTEQ